MQDTLFHGRHQLCQKCNPSRTVCALEPTLQDVPYFSSFTAKSWLKDLENIGQGQRLDDLE